MDTNTTMLTAVLAGIAVVIVGTFLVQRASMKRGRILHQRFGPEYDAVKQSLGKDADAELQHRVERVRKLSLTALDAPSRERFLTEWRSAQARFVDDPKLAIAEADRLVTEVMQALGYPMADFDQRAADISVDHPQVVQNYRAAHEVAEQRAGGVDTEQLRLAMTHYKRLFHELVGAAAPDTLREALS